MKRNAGGLLRDILESISAIEDHTRDRTEEDFLANWHQNRLYRGKKGSRRIDDITFELVN